MQQLVTWIIDLFKDDVPNWLFAITVLLFAFFGPLQQVLNDERARQDKITEAENQNKEQIAELIDSGRQVVNAIETLRSRVEDQYEILLSNSDPNPYDEVLDESSHLFKTTKKFRDTYKRSEDLALAISSIDVYDGSNDNKLTTKVLLDRLKEIKPLGEDARILVQNRYQDLIEGAL